MHKMFFGCSKYQALSRTNSIVINDNHANFGQGEFLNLKVLLIKVNKYL